MGSGNYKIQVLLIVPHLSIDNHAKWVTVSKHSFMITENVRQVTKHLEKFEKEYPHEKFRVLKTETVKTII